MWWHAQKPDFAFRRNGRAHLNWRGRQFSRLLAGEQCTSACSVCTARASLCFAVMWRLLVAHSILLFPLHFSSPCVAVCHHISAGLYKPSQCFPAFLSRRTHTITSRIPRNVHRPEQVEIWGAQLNYWQIIVKTIIRKEITHVCVLACMIRRNWSIFPICRGICVTRANKMHAFYINPFRSYIGPRPTVWFSSSVPMSEDVRRSLCCVYSPAVGACPTLFM
jgi:hypothetical protein